MYELKNALASDNPEEYISHCHIHVDGSCNGMQHYAAFGRDEKGAEAVSLINARIESDTDPKNADIVNQLRG